MNEDELKAKAREMAEKLFEHHEPNAKAMIMEHFLTDIEERVKAFYAETGEWPVFRRDPGGHGRAILMATKDEIDQIPRRTRPRLLVPLSPRKPVESDARIRN